ncbi:DUF397 domain-containing protein [Streptomyces griseofuscus]|uniref:DUF397 domain-containing protein n=1 Tax=Streptomyces griseofuscus TaxID=146922 RepID=UPI00368740BE
MRCVTSRSALTITAVRCPSVGGAAGCRHRREAPAAGRRDPPGSARNISAESSYSNTGGECVEVARNVPDVVAVRDSKTPDGPLLRLDLRAWTEFTVSLG